MNRLKWRIVDRLIDRAGGDHVPETVAGGDCEAGSRAADESGQAVAAGETQAAEGAD